jgi:RNA polymerase sigma factor (sigma-70 family)
MAFSERSMRGEMMQRRPSVTDLNDAPAARLYHTHAPTILTYLRRRTASREDAEDLLLEVFLAAFERNSLAELPPDQQIAWLRRVAHHKLIDSYRRASRHPSVALDEIAETAYTDDDLDPEAQAQQHETLRDLQAALRKLSPAQQQVLSLRFADGLPCAEIANRLGKQEAAVRMLLSRTLNLLRSLYADR